MDVLQRYAACLGPAGPRFEAPFWSIVRSLCPLRWPSAPNWPTKKKKEQIRDLCMPKRKIQAYIQMKNVKKQPNYLFFGRWAPLTMRLGLKGRSLLGLPLAHTLVI